MISRTVRLRIFVDAALRMVLIALAVLPCLPMTLPRSSLATLSSMTEVCSPTISETVDHIGVIHQSLSHVLDQLFHRHNLHEFQKS